MKIAVYPYGINLSNDYVKRVVESILIGYPNAKITSFPHIKHIFSLFNYNYVWLNWFEDLPKKRKIKVFLIKLLTLLILKLMRLRIVATLHNPQPHECENSLIERILFFLTFKLSYKIIFLCDESRQVLLDKFGAKILKKAILVPHPTYDCKVKLPTSNYENFKVLFFGHLRPYKNIEMIFDIARSHPEISFTIAGKALNEKYERFLMTKAQQCTNVNLNCHFLSDDEIENLIDTHSILLLPYNIESSLNSGVVIYALCKAINVIVPTIGTIKQLLNSNEVFSYSYKTTEEHYEQITRILLQARKEYIEDYARFQDRAIKLHNEIIANQSPEAIAPILKKVFT